MAKINVSFDTESKEFSVDIDGSALKNVVGVRLYANGDDEGYINIELSDPETNGMRQYHVISASENVEKSSNNAYTDDKKFVLTENRIESLAREFSKILRKN